MMQATKMKLAIIGASDLGKLIAHNVLSSESYELVGFYDDTLTKGIVVEGFPILGKIDDVQLEYVKGNFDCLMIGIGYNHMDIRKSLFEKYSLQIPFASIIHSSCIIESTAKIGQGVFMLPGCVIDHNVIVSDNVLLNTGCIIAHDTKIGKHSFLSPAVSIAGKVLIGECCVLGINTTIIDHLSLGNKIRTGGGAVVIDSLEQSGLYVGIPARYKKEF